MSRESGKLLACPFTWKFKKISEKFKFYDNEYKEESMENDLMIIMYLISYIYRDTVNDNNDKAHEKLQKLKKYWEKFDRLQLQNNNVSVKVIVHIIEATEYYFLKKMGNLAKAQEIINNIEDSDDFKSLIEIGTLHGCESIARYNLDDDKNKGAISLAKSAISETPNCPIWYFVLGKYLRKNRRVQKFSKPSESEKKVFLKSYELSKDPFYGVFVAQMYRENEEYDKSNEIYMDIYDMEPSNPMIQLKLALGFTRKKDFRRAENCLNNAEKLIPNEGTFLHYKGIYLRKKKNYKEASEYFKRAAESGNFYADLDYGSLMSYNKNFNCLKHLEEMLHKYKGNKEQRIKLLIAMQHYNYKKNLADASRCILDAILINPESDMLKKFFDIYENKAFNVFDFIIDTLIPTCERKFPRMSPKMQHTLEELKNLCNEHRLKN